jgi:hypothetical protein
MFNIYLFTGYRRETGRAATKNGAESSDQATKHVDREQQHCVPTSSTSISSTAFVYRVCHYDSHQGDRENDFLIILMQFLYQKLYFLVES